MARTTKNTLRVVVTPATDNAYKERFLKINGKVIPFGVPVELTQNDINTVKRLKEPKRNTRNRNVYDVMDQLKISQEKANKIMRDNQDISQDVTIGFVPKYNISKA